MSFVGFRAKNHPQQVKLRGALDEVDERITPPAIFEPLHASHGFTLDVAANALNARCSKFFDRATNGLLQSWASEVVWCNPPWSDCRSWVEKAQAEVWGGECKKAVLLLPSNRTEQAWWQDLIETNRDGRGKPLKVDFLRGRLRFGWPAGRVVPKKGDRPPSGIAIVTIERLAK